MKFNFKALLIIGIIFMTFGTDKAIATDNRVLDIREYTTPKGLKFWHVADHSLPIVTINFAFKGSGSITDPADKIGLSQLVSNTLDEGAGSRDSQAFQEAIDDHAIELEYSTSRDFFSGKLKTLKRHSNLAFELLHDSLHTPKFDEEAINRMRQGNITRIKSSISKPEWLATRLMNDVYYGNHPYAKNSGGTLSGLMAIEQSDMKNFVQQSFVKNRLVIATAGDVTAEEAMQIIDMVFADLPVGKVAENITPVQPPKTPIKKAFVKDSPQSEVQMVWNGLKKNDPDYHAYRVMNHILGGGGFSSKLMDEIREKRGLTYGIYSEPIFMDYADYMVIQSSASPENVEPMTQAMKDVLTDMTTNNITDTVLRDAKSYLIGSLPLRFSSTLSLSGTAIRMQLDGRSINDLDEWSDKISKVTAEDVKNVAGRVFTSTEPTVTIIAGAVPSNQNFEIVDVIPGIE